MIASFLFGKLVGIANLEGGVFMNNFKKISIVCSVLALVFTLSACNKLKGNSGSEGANQPKVVQDAQQAVDAATQGTVVTFKDGAFSPSPVTVKSGEKLTWKNESDKNIQVASAPHPLHTTNPELTNGEFVIELAPGQSETVTLTTKGTFGYHDHLNASVFGQVVVE